MTGTIVVAIPNKCYISPDPKREFPFEFYFHVTYGGVPKESRILSNPSCDKTVETVTYPQITVGGFEKLLSEDKITPFLNDLKRTGDDDWLIKKHAANSNILFQYIGTELAPEFFFRAAAEKFISTAEDNKLVTLTVSIRNFQNIDNTDYIICTKVDYTPWAKSLTAVQTIVPFHAVLDICYECIGDNIDKRLYQNGAKLDSARSPYTATIDSPALFTLEAFNQHGMSDEAQLNIDIAPPQIFSFTADKYTFSEGESIKLTWEMESVSDISIDGLNPQTDSIVKNSANVSPVPSKWERTKRYTLRANGYKEKKPYSISAEVLLYQTNWSCSGAVAGFFSADTFSNVDYNRRIFTIDGKYYCYSHAVLYKSVDGLNWDEFAHNEKADPAFVCITADFYNDVLYVMGKQDENGEKLYISEFDFKTSVWTYSPAAQVCCSMMGGFSFSQKKIKYAQVISNGLFISSRGDDGQWNAGTSILQPYTGTMAVSGDYCFFKDRNYAVLLCNNNFIYVYDCDSSMEDVLFLKAIKDNTKFVNFVQTINNLYIIAGSTLINVKTQDYGESFSPPYDATINRPWVGASKDGLLFGVFPDRNLWILKE